MSRLNFDERAFVIFAFVFGGAYIGALVAVASY